MDTVNAVSTSRLLRLREVKALVALNHSEIYKRMKEGRFPKAIRLGPNATRWLEHEVREWIESFVHERV